MNFVLLLHLFFLFKTILAEPSPKALPDPNPSPSSHFFAAVQQQPQSDLNDFWSQVNSLEPKTIMLSSSSDQNNSNEPNIIQTVMTAVTTGQNQENKDSNNSDIPEIVFPDPTFPEQIRFDQSVLPSLDNPRTSQVYNLPPVTRMIATSEVDPDNRMNQIWRSPLPFIHPEECPHQKSSKKKWPKKKVHSSKKQRKSESKPKTTPPPKSTPESSERSDALASLLSSILSHTLSSSLSDMESPKTSMKFPPMMMISRRSEPQFNDLPSIIPEPMPRREPMLVAIIRKKIDPILAEPDAMVPPLNPIFSLLSRIHKPFDQSFDMRDEKSEEQPSDKTSKPQTNFNFNINLTINNHIYEPKANPAANEYPIPIILRK